MTVCFYFGKLLSPPLLPFLSSCISLSHLLVLFILSSSLLSSSHLPSIPLVLFKKRAFFFYMCESKKTFVCFAMDNKVFLPSSPLSILVSLPPSSSPTFTLTLLLLPSSSSSSFNPPPVDKVTHRAIKHSYNNYTQHNALSLHSFSVSLARSRACK